MTVSRSIRHLAGPAIVAILVAACSSPGPAGSGGAVGSVATSAKVVAISGAVTGTIDAPGGCGEGISDAASWEGSFQTDDGAWTLGITLEGTMAPGTYSTAWHEAGMATVWIYQGGGGDSFEAAAGDGTVRLDPDSKTGSVDVEVTNAADGSTANVVGEWTCE